MKGSMTTKPVSKVERATLRREKKVEALEGSIERRARVNMMNGGNNGRKFCLVRTQRIARDALRAKREERAARKEKRNKEAGIKLI